MLILTREVGEQIKIGHDITLTVVRRWNGRLAIGVDAPREVEVYRREIYVRKFPSSPKADVA
jgi:carbon storage regulator